MIKSIPLVASILLMSMVSCSKDPQTEPPPPVTYPVKYKVTAGIVDEASGIADSKANPGFLWVQQDSGNPNEIALFSYTAEFIKKINIKGITNRDWEDIAVAPGPDPATNYIYLAETGDNNSVYGTYYFYRFPEPSKSVDTVYNAETIAFKYPDGNHDAEAFLVEPGTLDIYVITKRDAKSGIYKISYPYSTTAVNNAVFIASLPYNIAVSAAMEPDGKGLVVKDYWAVNFYARNPGESIATVLAKTPVKLDYVQEQQGEAITFTADSQYYFTLSERVNADVYLQYFKK